MEVFDRMRSAFASSGMLMKIIYINIGIFVALRLFAIVCVFSGNPAYIDTILSWIKLPSQPAALLARPWTILTYMFAQYDLWHIIFNMLWFYWFGSLFRMVANDRQLLVLYLYGGIAGGLLFMAGYAALPLFHDTYGVLIGSSASVIAIVTAVAILMPDFKMYLLLIGAVAVKWVAIITILLVLIGLTGSNAGGEIAHVGGVIAGMLFAMRYKKGSDITAPIVRIADRLSSLTRRHLRPATSSYTRKSPRATASTPSGIPNSGLSSDERRELDIILEKIKKSGYSALTPAERDRLFSVSRKIK